MPRQKQSHILSHLKELYPFSSLYQPRIVSHTLKDEEISGRILKDQAKENGTQKKGGGSNLDENTGNTIRL